MCVGVEGLKVTAVVERSKTLRFLRTLTSEKFNLLNRRHGLPWQTFSRVAMRGAFSKRAAGELVEIHCRNAIP